MVLPVIFDASEADFDQSVIQASFMHPILVDFWAEWCPPCIVLTPVLEEVARTDPRGVRLAKIEADENMRLAGRYKLRGFPTVILLHEGEERGRFSGARPASMVRAFLDQHLRKGAA